MAFEYLLTHSCPVKDAFPKDALIGALEAKATLKRHRDSGRRRGLSERQILAEEVPIHLHEGGEKRVKIEKLKTIKKRVDQLEALRDHCQDCPANCSGRDFGCHGTIRYPISGEGEAWIMRNFCAAEAAESSQIHEWIREHEIRGEGLARVRAERLGLGPEAGQVFEMESAATKVYEDETGERREVTSDQIFELMMSVGRWEEELIVHFLKDCGAIGGEQADGFAETARDDAEGERSRIDLGSFEWKLENGVEDATAREFGQFLYALYVAQQSGCAVISMG